MMDAELARKLWSYDRKSGELRWRPRPVSMFTDGLRRNAAHACAVWHTKFAGKVAGTISEGRVCVCYDGQKYKASQIIWAIVTGTWPNLVDHKDGDSLNNRWYNLRRCPRGQLDNMQNKKIYKSNTSGYPGVSWYPKYGKWLARISVDGKRIMLGYFDDFETAKAVRIAA